MLTLELSHIVIAATAIGVLILFQGVLNLSMLLYLRASSREVNALNREIFGLVRKLEGLTASKREQVLSHYDKVLEELSNRLPTTIAAQASHNIFEMESRVLTRLAELEPSLKVDEVARKRMDDLIHSMEKLEHVLVSSTADTVKKILVESRTSLFSDDTLSVRSSHIPHV